MARKKNHLSNLSRATQRISRVAMAWEFVYRYYSAVTKVNISCNLSITFKSINDLLLLWKMSIPIAIEWAKSFKRKNSQHTEYKAIHAKYNTDLKIYLRFECDGRFADFSYPISIRLHIHQCTQFSCFNHSPASCSIYVYSRATILSYAKF